MARARRAALLTLLLVCAALVAGAAAAAGAGKGKDGPGRVEAPLCRDLTTRGECTASGAGSRCRWCRSEELDDMCFGAAEAWRLPRQVFSCDPPAAAAHGHTRK
ncbi:uncharacterized protein LOC133919748 [Phragmites australis]|uniref:uncharacterized protein LOC133919748 n=1 Tax=Phragmites australis TaxID=29695 RepID=UPI002D790867|nr:uncharacterized protein LOC133919748 [Phragmites australis]